MLNKKGEKECIDIYGFCKEFVEAKPSARYVFGINEYAKSIASVLEVAGFIDDFTSETIYLDKPIVTRENLPENALVISSLFARPLTAEKVLNESGIRHLDIFSFHYFSGIDISIRSWGGFIEEFNKNREKYYWLENLLCDAVSREQYRKIINFRLTANLTYLEGFYDKQKEQYFEDFLKLELNDEVFVDVGGYDGFTTEEFIKRCPGYSAAYVFEPEVENVIVARKRLENKPNVHIYQKGLSNEKATVSFSSDGAGSIMSSTGDKNISVDLLDDLVDDKVTFIKMDIEGAESLALEGAKNTIKKHHPRLAICVYHKVDDLWKIPEQVFNIREDYELYLRHYTEGVVETVMFFMPVKS